MDLVYKQQALLQECYDCLINLHNSDSDTLEIRRVLNKLNECNYSFQFVSSRDADVLTSKLAEVIPLEDDDLVSRYCQLIFDICTKQQVTLEDATLQNVLKYILKSLHHCRPWALPSIIGACGALLYSNVSRVKQLWDPLFGSAGMFETLLSPTELDSNIHLASLRALRAVTIRTSGEQYLTDAYLTRIVDLLLGSLTDTFFTSPAVQAETLMVSALKCLQNIFSTKWKLPSDRLGRLLGVLKSLSFYGFPGQKNRHCPSLAPSPLCTHLPRLVVHEEDQPKPLTVKKKNRRKRHKKGNNKMGEESSDCTEDEENYTKPLPPWKKVSSSESEFSDSESGQLAKQRFLQCSVRRNVYITLRAVVKVVDKREMFGYWLNFLPDIPITVGAPQTQTILLTILKDPNLQVRIAALELLTDFVTQYKPFLGLASHSGFQRTAFTTLSQTVAAILGEVHRCLHLALIAENSPAQVIQLLKCLAAVVAGSPYHRLQQGLLSRVIIDTAIFLDSKDFQVQVASLTVFWAVALVTPAPEEVNRILSVASVASLRSASKGLAPESSESWLVLACTAKLLADMSESLRISTTVVRIEALQVLVHMCQSYFHHLMKSADAVAATIKLCLSDTNLAIKLHAVKLLGALSKRLKEIISAQPTGETSQGIDYLSLGHRVWLECALNGTLQAHLQDFSEPVLQAESCNCLSAIGPHVWDSLPEDRKVLCVTLLLALARAPNVEESGPARGEEALVRNAAIRCLGIFITHGTLREDLLFLMDVGDVVIEALADSNVQVKTSWTLSNLTEILAELRKQGSKTAAEVPETFLCSLGRAAICLQQDKNQTQANAVRAIGCLLQFFSKENLANEGVKKLVSDSTEVLIHSLRTGLMKVRWNACYSLGSLLGNMDIISGHHVNLASVFEGLVSSLKDCSNLKVRIQAAAALSVPKERSIYGPHFEGLWHSTLVALEQAEQQVDYRELQHQHQLREQLCLIICHLLELADIQDLPSMESAILDHELRISNAFTQAALQTSLLEPLTKAHNNLLRLFEQSSGSTTRKLATLLGMLLERNRALTELPSKMLSLEVS